jgi:hypothetical protein
MVSRVVVCVGSLRRFSPYSNCPFSPRRAQLPSSWARQFGKRYLALGQKNSNTASTKTATSNLASIRGHRSSRSDEQYYLGV